MSGSGSPCGACKFLRRKCVNGCIFAPYFSNEQGATYFSAIHKVFGASNVSKWLAHIPPTQRCQAAITISYEAQARLQDPIYGCVSHIFALQHQVILLQAQLTILKEQAAQILLNGYVSRNPSFEFDSFSSDQQEQPLQDHALNSWIIDETENYTPTPSYSIPEFNQNLQINNQTTTQMNIKEQWNWNLRVEDADPDDLMSVISGYAAAAGSSLHS